VGEKKMKKKLKKNKQYEEKNESIETIRPPNPESKRSPYPKRKVLFVVGYLGANYHGLQRNPGVITIDDVLEKAFADSGGISENNKGHFNKTGWSTCARTDKGVSAVANMITFKAIMVPDLLEQVNSRLPNDLRVFLIRRVTNGFSARKRCTSRIYQYLIPTFVFDPQLRPKEEEDIKFEDIKFRLSSEIKSKIEENFKKYEGTHNFHNFTKGTSFEDKSANRYIISITCGDPHMNQGIEWMMITVQGQSFMLHQIRKMVGLIAIMIRGLNVTVEECYQSQKRNIPMAPSLGLFLNRITFEQYNGLPINNPHGPITYDGIKIQLDSFMNDVVIPHIISSEFNKKIFIDWIRYECNDRNKTNNEDNKSDEQNSNDENNNDED